MPEPRASPLRHEVLALSHTHLFVRRLTIDYSEALDALTASASVTTLHIPLGHITMTVLCLAPTTTLHKPTVRATKSVCQQGSLCPPGVFGDFSCIKCSGTRRGWRETECDRGHKKHMLSFLGFIQHLDVYVIGRDSEK